MSNKSPAKTIRPPLSRGCRTRVVRGRDGRDAKRVQPRSWLLALATALLALALPPAASAQNSAISGRVWSTDGLLLGSVGVRLVAATDSTRRRVADTDRLGFFAFTDVTPGAYVLTVTRIGYAAYKGRVEVAAGTPLELDISLVAQPITLEGIAVEAERSRARARFEESAGATVQEISRVEMKSLPILVETDPIRAVEVLPGVTTVSDFTAAFNVRGGSADQNLILLDDIPIFNPFHLGGVFSVFNADMVQRAELQAGGFPAAEGLYGPGGPRQHAVARVRPPLLLRRSRQAVVQVSLSPDGPAGSLRGVDEGGQPLALYRLYGARCPRPFGCG